MLKRILFALLFLIAAAVPVLADCPGYGGLFGCQLTGSDWQAMTALGLQITSATMVTAGPSGYTFTTNDLPTGGYYNLVASNTPSSGTTTLPAAMVAGTPYRVFWKILGYDKCSTLTLTIGAVTSSSVAAEDRSPNGPICAGSNGDNSYWTIAATITPAVTTASATITVTKGSGVDNQFGLMAMFITSNANVTIMSDDTFANLTAPATRDTTVTTSENIWANGSFEAGCDPGQFSVASTRSQDPTAYCSTDMAYSGSKSLKIDLSNYTSFNVSYSRVILLKPNRQYTITARARLSSGAGCSSGTVLIGNTFIAPAGFVADYPNIGDTRPYIGSAKAVCDSAWADFTATGYAIAFPTAEYHFEFGFNGVNPITCACTPYVYLDALGICEGTTCTYSEANPLEITLASGKAGNVFYTSDTLQFTATAYNSTGASITKSLYYEILTQDLTRVVSGTSSFTVGAGVTATSTFTPSSVTKQGWMVLRYWFTNEDHTERELPFVRIPNYQTSSTGSMMGVHCPSTAWSLSALNRLGFTWCRLLSPVSIAQMNFAEAVEGTFTYYDSTVAAITSAGFSPLGILFCRDSGCPAYALSGSAPNIAKFVTFTTAMVHNYKASVHYWEIENEPDHRSWWALSGGDPTLYGQLLHDAGAAVKAEDATAKLVCMGGATAAFITSVKTWLEANYAGWYAANCDYASGHVYYGGQNPDSFTTIVDTYGAPVWNTESGTNDRGSNLGVNSGFNVAGTGLYGYTYGSRFYSGLIADPDAQVRIIAQSLNAKMSSVYMYDARDLGPDNKLVGWSSGSWSMLEYDGSVSSKAAADAVAGSFLDHATRQGDKGDASTSKFLLFEQASTTPVAVLTSNDYRARQVTLTGSNSDYALYDLMGNAITPSSGTVFNYGRHPVYLTCTCATATLSTRLLAGAIATRTDTVGPNVVIIDGKREAVISGDRVRMRWLAYDDVSLPNLGETNAEAVGTTPETANPDAILYAYHMDSDGWSSWAQDTYVDLTGVAAGNHTFYVKAKDAAGNESNAVSWDIGPAASVGRTGRRRIGK